MSWKPEERWKYPGRHEREQQRKQALREMPDQALCDCYAEEKRKLKMVLRWNQQEKKGERPCVYPNTLIMNQCAQELKRRGLSLPEVHLLEGA